MSEIEERIIAEETMSETSSDEERESLTSASCLPLIDRISSPPISHFLRRLKLGKKWLNGFRSNLQSLDAILDDAELKAYENKQLKMWVDELSEVSYDVKVLLDEISKKPGVINFSDKLTPLEEITKQRLEAIAEKIVDLREQRDALRVTEDWEASQIIWGPSVDREDFEDESQVIGRDEEKKAILELLLSDGHQTDVITMVGEDGVGKTTLAQLVYNDEKVEKQFEFKAWIHVSEDFDDLSLTKAIFLAFTDRPSFIIDDPVILQTSLKYHILHRKKFLLVLDNLTMRSDWRNLQKVLTDGANGSRIIVTTPKLEENMGTLPAFTVRSLTKEESWMLYAKHAFPDKSSSLLPKLEDIGKEIVEKCRGLPLAVKILASVRRFKSDKEWQELLNNNSILKRDEVPLNSILKMCYNDLPIHLKQCVTSCSIFPTLHEYEEEKLILLWMAQGFLPSSLESLHPEERKRREEAGSAYFRNLIDRSFFQPSGANKSCFVMHDLLKGVIHSESGFTCSRMGNDEYSEVSSRPWHMLISGGKDIAERSKEAKFLRTLILRKSSWEKESCQLSGEQLNILFEALQCLRVLSLSGYDITKLPDSIGKLHCLRFLDLSHTAITQLSDSVSFLYNLETLLLSNCSRLTELPDSLHKLRNLRFLDLSHTAITQLPDSVTSLKQLEKLWLSNCSGLTKLPYSFYKLNYLRFLDLSHTAITHLPHRIHNLETLLLSNCSCLTEFQYSFTSTNLRFLDLSHSAITMLPLVLPNLQKLLLSHCTRLTELPHSLFNNMTNLQFLDLSHTEITKLPRSVGNLCQLQKLLLSHCTRLTELPFWLDLKNLQFLDLSHTEITKLPGSAGTFPKLQKLLLSHCTRFTELPKSFHNMTNLQLLDLSHTAITEIPFDSLKNLDKLQNLLLSHCTRLTELPDLFHYLTNLQFIDISHTAITKLPDSVSFLPNLQIVFPENMGKLINLRPLDSRGDFPEVEGQEFPDSNVVQRTDVSITSNSPPPKSPKHMTEDSSAKHGGASTATEVSYVIVPIDAEESLEDNETIKIPPPESPKHLTEDSSAKHGGASAATEISSDTDTDDPIDAEEILEDISSPEQENLDVSEISQLKRLPPKLYSLKIEGCDALKSLHGKLKRDNPYLQHLYIIDCHFLESIRESHLPIALKTLYISKSKKLEIEFLSSEYTSIEHLCIESGCDSLESFPLSSFPKLRNLSIRDCANFTSISIGLKDHMSLDALEIRDCPKLTSFPVRIPNLTSILLSNCKNLKELPDQLHGLTSLQSLFMKECPELESIPGGLPSSLNLLCISSCHKLTPRVDWGLHKLNSFSCIEIEGGCKDLESFPEQNLLPMNLTSLRISRLMNLKFLDYKGLEHLTSLETLKINSCGKLQSFPAEGLPSSLSYLYISDCPLLKSKLQNRRGKEWYKIAHIPHIQIDMEVIS